MYYTAGIRAFFFVIILFVLAMFSGCESEEQASPQEVRTTVSASEYTGEWKTSATYSEYENAVMRINADDGDMISGRLQYQQRLGPGDETNPASRYFFEGSPVGNTFEASFLTENGDEIGIARLTLLNGELHVQMLNRQDRLPEIFILEKSGSDS